MKNVFEELANLEKAIAKMREALESEESDAREVYDEVDLGEAIQDNYGPDAVAIIAVKLRGGISSGDECVDMQYQHFADMLAELVGGWDSAIHTARQLGIE